MAKILGVVVICGAVFAVGPVVAQELETKVKGTGQKVKLEKSGSGWEVGDTGRKVDLDRSGSEIEVKGTDVKLEPDRADGSVADSLEAGAKEVESKIDDVKGKLSF